MINKMYKVINNDCLKELKKMGGESVDVVITSPPYNEQHDKYLVKETYDDYFEWLTEILDECIRVSKTYTLVNIQSNNRNKQDVYKLIGHYSQLIHDILIWHKPNGQPSSTHNKISNTYEFVIIIKKYKNQGVDVQSKFFRNVILANVNVNEFSEIHGAVMNKNVCNILVREFSKENDVVLDPFSGMATTGVCCIEMNRNYIGFEIDKTYYNESIKRLNETQDKKESRLF